ncbi:hypothetical protein AB0953_01475 [Streptomyces sp. NPDC046866]|uniref:hypothetical protein n=1 Tax=Streptomyces sp. NPDC046866 TaxID=3154921 RepID=UPI0034516293
MRKQFLGFIAAAILSVLGAVSTAAAHAAAPAVDAQTCATGGGSVEYDSSTGLWTCIGGTYDGAAIS